jgi:RNA polymerase sigma factor (sigma-70 family)
MEEQISSQFIEAVNRHAGIIHKICTIYFKDSEDYEDARQEMLFQLWKSYPHFQKTAKLSTWMYRVCLNTAFTFVRRRKRHVHESITDRHYEVADDRRMPGDDVEQLYLTIEVLSPLNKAIILLYLDEQTYEEIAGITGISKSNVSVRLVRIKKILEKELRKTRV